MSDKCYFKLHKIACQGTSLITKHILDLPDFFIQGWWIYLGSSVPPFTEHQFIMIDEIRLADLGHFYSNHQRDRNHGIKQHQIGTKHQKPISDCAIPSPKDIIMSIFIITHKPTIQTTKNRAKYNLKY